MSGKSGNTGREMREEERKKRRKDGEERWREGEERWSGRKPEGCLGA